MITTIAIFEDGTEEFADVEQCFDKLTYLLASKPIFMMNTMKRFSEELIIRVLQFKSYSLMNIPWLFANLKPVGLLHNVGNYFYIVHLVNHLSSVLDDAIERMFDRDRPGLSTENGMKFAMEIAGTEFFGCRYHLIHQICPITGNSTLLHNFLHYLAFSIRLAGVAFILGIADGPKWISEYMAVTIKDIHARLNYVGGWQEIKKICENFEVNRRSVGSIKYVTCGDI